MVSDGPMSESGVGITFGCLYFGLVFTSILLGVGCLQLYLYYENYCEYDRKWFKVYIFTEAVLDTVHQCIFMSEMYSYFVKSIANPSILGIFSKSFITNIAVSGFLAGMVHFIFIRRVWYLSNKNWAITRILATSAIALFVTTLVASGYMSRLTELAQLSSISHLLMGLNVIAGFTDTLISVVLIWLLWRTRSGIKRTDSIITRLIIYTVSTGLVIALWAIMALVSAAVAPNSFLYLLADVVIPKLQFNCMLASLNVRSHLRATPLTSGMSVNLSNLSATSGTSSSRAAGHSNKVANSKVLECQVDIGAARGSDGQITDQKVAGSDVNIVQHP